MLEPNVTSVEIGFPLLSGPLEVKLLLLKPIHSTVIMASNETLESWEDFQDYEAAGRKVSSKKKSIDSNNLNDVDPSLAHSMVVTEETHRTQYKPQIRILKREPPSTGTIRVPLHIRRLARNSLSPMRD